MECVRDLNDAVRIAHEDFPAAQYGGIENAWGLKKDGCA